MFLRERKQNFMKSNKKLFVLAGIALLGGLVSGCSSEKYSDGVIQIDGDVYAISATEKTLSYVAVDQVVNLDEYFQVVMDDENSTVTHKYTVTCDDENVTIDGHKVTGKKVGDYELRLAVNDKDKYITLSVKSAYNMELINFFSKFEESDGKNYRIDLGEYDEGSKEFEYGNYTIIHNPDYAAAFDAEDPGALDEDGEANSFILANLSDGNGYMGYFDTDGKPVFENGKMNINNYYITGSMILDGGSFTSTVDEVTGEEILVGGSKQADTFLSYGMSNLVTRYGYTPNSFYVLDLLDEDKDGEKDTLYAKITVDGNGTDGNYYTDQEWCTVKISEVGTCKWDSLEVAIKSDAYVPAKIQSPEIATALSALIKGGNYTSAMQIYACDSDGKALEEVDEDTSAMDAVLGTTDVITEYNCVSSATDIQMQAYIGEDLVAQEAYWKDSDGKYYLGTYTPATEESEEKITKTEDATGAGLEVMKSYRVDNVDLDTIDDVDWSNKVTQGTYVAFAGSIGDDADGVKTNGFFAGLFDQMFCFEGLGTFLTKDGTVKYTDGSTCSYTFSSSYSSVVVDTSSNAISVSALIYLPFQDITQPYIMFQYMIGRIGSTTNDFSTYANGTAVTE